MKKLPMPSLLNRDSGTRRAPVGHSFSEGRRRLDVQSDVGDLSLVLRGVRSREAVLMRQISFPWHDSCYGWRVKFISCQMLNVKMTPISWAVVSALMADPVRSY
jgi:hypothetical protein